MEMGVSAMKMMLFAGAAAFALTAGAASAGEYVPPVAVKSTQTGSAFRFPPRNGDTVLYDQSASSGFAKYAVPSWANDSSYYPYSEPDLAADDFVIPGTGKHAVTAVYAAGVGNEYQNFVNIIFFSGSQSCFAKSPRPLDAQSRRELTAFVDRSGLEPATDLYGALEKALTMVGNPDTGRLYEDGVDTIVVLSDGQATVGRIVDDELIAQVVTRRARYLRPVFHTVSLSSDSKSLRLLAERTGGEYRAK